MIRILGVVTLLGVLAYVMGCAPGPQDSGTLVTTSVRDSVRFHRMLIDPDLGNRALYVAAADLTGDDALDLMAGGFWYEHPAAAGSPWVRRPIGAPLHNVLGVLDIDGDGDRDLIGTQGIGDEPDGAFVWAENDGVGGFTIHTNIPASEGSFVRGLAGGRFRGDGPIEIALSWDDPAKGIEMLSIPADPKGEPWVLRRISEFSEGGDLSAGDIDGDGDLDLFLGTHWLENPGDATSPWPLHQIGEVTGGRPGRNDLADFDGDGNLDAVVALVGGDDVLLFLRGSDPKAPWERKVLASGIAGGHSMDVGDIDGDGDIDVVVGEHAGAEFNRVLVYLNNGLATEWVEVEIDRGLASVIDHHHGTQFVDVDLDGDLDVISLGWTNRKVWVWRQR